MPRKAGPDPGWLQIQRERFGPDYQPPHARSECRAGDVIPKVLKNLGLQSESRLREITAVWPEVAGQSNAAHSHPGRWEKGILTIFVDHHLWLNELKTVAAPSLLKRLQERMGKGAVKQLRFEMAPEDTGPHSHAQG